MTKVKIMTEKAVNYVKKNISQLVSHYNNWEDPELWISEKIGESAFIRAKYLDTDDFVLQVENINSSATEIENSKRMYSHFSFISDAFAADERLWAGLSHTLYFDFMRLRWGGECKSSEDILNHFFFKQASQRALNVNTLSHYWWIGRKTYRPGLENPWRIADFIGRDIVGIGFMLFGSNWPNDQRNMDTFFNAIFYLEGKGLIFDRYKFKDLMKYMNCLCGMYHPGSCRDDIFEKKLIDYAEKSIFR